MPQLDPLRPEGWECIERQLRTKLDDPKERYELAKLSLGVDHVKGTQGDDTTEYSHALEQYDEAVKRFTDYVLRGESDERYRLNSLIQGQLQRHGLRLRTSVPRRE